ncbi:MAG: response regulator transcription factor [Acidobacteria bacterium]|nr:response regulator transcription factor [Acidobacteriota bacterium]
MAVRRVLIIEDDAAIRAGIADALQFHGYALEESDGRAGAVELALRATYDLLLLDLVLPGGDGLDILREVHRFLPTLPVIILSARGEEADRIAGLRLGADDYLVKPFSVKELIARMEAVLRRSPERPRPAAQIHFAGGVAIAATGEVQFADGTARSLSSMETELLRYLSMNAGRVLSREEILARVWHITAKGMETRTVDMHIARLRDKLRDSSEEIIQTVRGKGYCFASHEDGAADSQ